MRYISIFSGIEAASCAWETIGFEPVAFAEIDKYASAVFCRGNHHSKAACYEELAPTLTAHAKAEAPLISLTPPRHLTPRECERLQGFPDDWTAVSMSNGKPVSNTQRYKMLGNSMAVPVMRWIGARILLVERSNNAN